MWWIIAALIFVGILFILAEMLLVPGVGVAGFVGIISLAASCWYAFDKVSTRAGLIITAVNVVLAVIMLVIALREKTWKRFELGTEINSKVNNEVSQVKAGDRGVAMTRLAPMGTVKFDKVSCEAKSFDNCMIAASTEVEVVLVEDNKVIVKTI